MSEKNSMQEQKNYKAETDFRELKTNPSKLFPVYYVFIFGILVLIGVTYISQLTTIGKNSVQPLPPPDSASFVHDIQLQSPRTVPPVDVMKASVSTPEAMTTGKSLFKANCTSCHGENGLGDGPTSVTLNPKPRNFTSDKGWTNGSKISQIYKTLEMGIVANGMPSFNYLTPQDRFALIHYVRSLHDKQPMDSTDELHQLDATFGLAKGMTVAGTMPIRRAKDLIMKEHTQEMQSVAEFINTTEQSDAPGSMIIHEYACNEERVFASALTMSRQITGSNEFIEMIAANPVQYGFKASITRLSTDDWVSLYSYLMLMVKQ